jgi:HlyD family secretion protein
METNQSTASKQDNVTSQPTTNEKSKIKKPRSQAGRGGGLVLGVSGILALGAIGGAVYYFQHQNQSDEWQKNTVSAEKGSIDVQIIATGTVKPVSEIKVSPKSTGQIRKLLVQQGDYVKAGDIIAEMDDSNLAGQIEAARGNYLVAKDTYDKVVHGNRPEEVSIAHLQEVRANNIVQQAQQNITRLKANLESITQQELRDDTNAARQTYLESQGAISDQDRLNAVTTARMTHAQYEAARRELAQAEATLAQNKTELASAAEQHHLTRAGSRTEDIRAAEHAVVQAKGNLDTLEADRKDTVILAPFAGVITQKYADMGAIVTPTTSAATTSATSSSIVALAGTLEVVAEVAETDISKIKIGQPLEIVSNAYPEKPFHGKVTQIAPEAVVTQNVTTFEVHTTIDDDRKHRLLSGMNVSARFNAGKLDDVILIPTVCVVSRHGKAGVLMPIADESGKPKFKPVKVGPTVGTQTAILRGLKEHDRIYLGLNKEQLEQQGYGGDSGGGPGGPGGGRGGRGSGGGGGGGAPIPRSFGR